jgi:hypothetical protein
MMAQAWQYQVEQFGSALKPAKPEEIEVFLNEAALEGWEPSHIASMSNGSKLLVVLRQKMEGRARRRTLSWPYV